MMTVEGVGPRDNGYAAADWAQAHAPDRFVAVWLDGATAHAQFTSALTPAELASLRAAVPAPDTLSIDTVQNSLPDLLRVRDAISADASALRAGGIHLVGVGLRHSINRVTVRATGSRAAAEQVLHTRYGAEVVEVVSGPAATPVGRGA